MSANTTIQEGGKSYPFGPVKCLMVEGDNGEFYPWYPEADRALDSLSVTQNGIYRASDRGVYGWNRVSVNVAQSDRVTGKDPETGEEKTVTVDPQTGELVETIVPTEIRVTTLPTKTEYTNGEIIDYSGIVVHAYSSTGQDMGAVPFGELVFPVTTAQGGDEWSDGHGLNATMLYYTPHWLRMEKVSTGETSERQVFVCAAIGSYGGRPAAYGSSAGPATMLATRYCGHNYMLRVSAQAGRIKIYSRIAMEKYLEDSNITGGMYLAPVPGFQHRINLKLPHLTSISHHCQNPPPTPPPPTPPPFTPPSPFLSSGNLRTVGLSLKPASPSP